MTIGELKAKIRDFPDDADVAVYLYSTEDGGYLFNVDAPVKVKDANTKYCKGDSPLDPRYNEWAKNNPEAKVVWLIGG